MDSRGTREIATAKANVSTARKYVESSADSFARARRRLAEFLDEVNQCERQVREASDNLKDAQQHLEDLEKRFEVIDVDDETSQKPKRPRLSRGGGGGSRNSGDSSCPQVPGRFGDFGGAASGFGGGSATTTPFREGEGGDSALAPTRFGKNALTTATAASTPLGQSSCGFGFGTVAQIGRTPLCRRLGKLNERRVAPVVLNIHALAKNVDSAPTEQVRCNRPDEHGIASL